MFEKEEILDVIAELYKKYFSLPEHKLTKDELNFIIINEEVEKLDSIKLVTKPNSKVFLSKVDLIKAINSFNFDLQSLTNDTYTIADYEITSAGESNNSRLKSLKIICID